MKVRKSGFLSFDCLTQILIPHKRDDIYGKYVYFQLLEDQSFSQFLNSNGKKVLGLLAAKKRAFFKKQLKNQKMILFSAFELMKLGDIQESLLLYIINHENNIL